MHQHPMEIDRFPSGDSVGSQILNMFNTDGQPTLSRVGCHYGESVKNNIPTDGLLLTSVDSELESADSSADSNADPPKIGVWVQAIQRRKQPNPVTCSLSPWTHHGFFKSEKYVEPTYMAPIDVWFPAYIHHGYKVNTTVYTT